MRKALNGIIEATNDEFAEAYGFLIQRNACLSAMQSAKPDPLYAAAPEMLEVMENLILEDDAAGGNMTDQTYNSIRAVIRKAKNPIPA